MTSLMFDVGSFGMDAPEPNDRRLGGVCAARVISNTDSQGEGRVQVEIPWLPGFTSWARVVSFMTGTGYGSYWIPQPGDEVLVAFNQGDVREVYVIGSLWSTMARPHEMRPDAPWTQRSIRTPSGHTISFDETGTLSITSSTFDSVTLAKDGIEVATVGSTASLKLTKTGDLTISAVKSITLDAPSITLGGKATVDISLKGKAGVSIDGGASCTVKAARIDLN